MNKKQGFLVTFCKQYFEFVKILVYGVNSLTLRAIHLSDPEWS